MAGWTKLDHNIIHSTVWKTPPHIKHTWTTMLILADKNGYVGASIPGLADQTGFSLEQTEEALEFFQRPDKYSRTKDNEGRRITEMDGGWKILNFEKYRGPDKEERRREQNRLAKQRQRERECQQKTLTVSNVSNVSHNKNKNKNKKDLSASLRESVTSKDPLSSVGSSGKKDPFLLATNVLTNADQKKAKTGKTPGSRVWIVYSAAYERKYGIPPKGNAKNYKHCKDLVGRLGERSALEVAEYYPEYRNSYHAGRGHALGCLLADCETVYTAMMTGNQITAHQARTDDRRETTRSALESYLMEREREEKAEKEQNSDRGIDEKTERENNAGNSDNVRAVWGG